MTTKFLSHDELEKLPTKRVLAYRNSLFERFCEGPSHEVTMYGGSDAGTAHEITKQSPEWREAMSRVKDVLAAREHVPSRREVAQQ